MKKTLFILLLCFLITSSFLVGQIASAAACPSDVIAAGSGICGESTGVKAADGWCCRDTKASGYNSSEWEIKSGYCGSPDGPGGKYNDWSCGKKKDTSTTTTGSTPTTTSSSSTAASSVDLSSLSPVGNATPAEIIGRVIKAILGVVGALALFMFVYGGLLMLTSAGSPEKVKKGKDVLVWAIIGLGVIFGSFYLVDFAITGITGGGGIGNGGSVPPTTGPTPIVLTCDVKYATSIKKECIAVAEDCATKDLMYKTDTASGLCPTAAEKCCYTQP